MSRRASSPRKTRKSKAAAAPRNRRLDEVPLETASKVASAPKRKSKAGSKGSKETMTRKEQRAEERRIRAEERQVRREERKEAWQQKTAWLHDPRVRQSIGVVAMALGGIMLLAGISACLLYTSPSPRDRQKSRMPSSA